MLSLILGIVCGFSSQPSFAQSEKKESGTLKCSFESNYLDVFSKDEFSINFEDSFIGSRAIEDERQIAELSDYLNGDEFREFSWSQTECEDSTDIIFGTQDFQDLKSGKTKVIGGRLTHAEPGVELKATVNCSYEKAKKTKKRSN